jgi:hypothetical protein
MTNRRQEVAAAPESGDEQPFRHDVDTSPTHRRRSSSKNTRSWCKGKTGRKHTLVIEVPANDYRRRPCGWRKLEYVNRWGEEPYYECSHVELCSTCGKVFRRHYGWMKDSPLADRECPDYTDPTPPQTGDRVQAPDEQAYTGERR